MWGFVSGRVEWGEEVREAVIRKTKKETNLNRGIVNFVGKYYDKRGRHPTKTMICLPHICGVKGGKLKAGDDALEARWFPLKEIKKMELAFDHKQMLIDKGLLK